MRVRLALSIALIFTSELRGESVRVGIIDFYGLHRVPQSQARAAVMVREGDEVVLGGELPASFVESKRRLTAIPGVISARLELVCCDEGRAIVYVGIQERGAPVLHFRAGPRGAVRLGNDIVQAGDELSRAWMAAVQRGDVTEDDSNGHALMHDPATRAIQERFIVYARDVSRLRAVLRHSSDAAHRALAAQILGYAADKHEIVQDLVYAMRDPAADVRNNAMRALAVIARGAATSRAAVAIPYDPLIRLLDSPVWTDRNKATMALL